MKLFGLLAVLASLFQCASVSFEKNPPFTIHSASYKNWVGGVPGVSGTKVRINFKANTVVAFDSMFFKNKKAKIVIETINKDTFLNGHFSTSIINSKEDLVLHKDGKKEYGNKVPEKRFKFDLKDNEAVISYIIDNQIKYFKIENIKKEPTDYLPAARPK